MSPATIVLVVCLAFNVHSAALAGPPVTLPRTEALESVDSSLNETKPLEQTDDSKPKVNANQTNVCMTKGCVKASAQILDLFDENVDPCDNFYEFACGKFLRNTLIPDDKIAVMSFVHVQDKVQDQLRLMISDRSLANESKPFTLAKIFNGACMNLDTLEAKGMVRFIAMKKKKKNSANFEKTVYFAGIQPMVEILDKYGGWPVVKNDWDETNWDWIETNRNMSVDGVEDALIFSLAILTDQKNSTKRVLDVNVFVQANFKIITFSPF